jgi:hypothetical protein
MHIEELVSLSEPVPCPIILPIHVYGTSVRLNRSVRVLHLDILVTHERPGGEVCPIELRSTPEVSNGLFVFCSQRVVVTYTMSPSSSDVHSMRRERKNSYRQDNRPRDGLCREQESHVRV